MMGHAKQGVTGGYLGRLDNKIKDKVNREVIDLVVKSTPDV